jgi:hypothetical protein
MRYIKKHPTLLKEELNSDFIYDKLAKASKSDKNNTELKSLLDEFVSADNTKKQDSNYWINKLDTIYKGLNNNDNKGASASNNNSSIQNQPQSGSASNTSQTQGGSASNTSQTQGGSASVTAPTQGASASTPLTIDGLFGTIFKQEERQKWEMTDEDYKKMEYIGSQDVESWSYTPDDTDKDPIIKIVDLFQQAHQLYFTPQIPTGRPLGKVSQKTYLEYTYVGKEPGGGQWTEERAPNGPFIANSIFNKWRDGIEKIFQDKEMRKIFANSKFKVKNTTVVEEPNKQTKLESIKFINEAEEATATPSGNDKQGQIIFTFMRNMLDKNKLSDFDSNKNKLMFDYFGIKGDSVDKVTYNGTLIKKNKRDIEPKTFYWQVSGRPDYDKINKKFFAAATSNQLAFICIALEKCFFEFKANNKKEEFKGIYFYYWKNNDKIIRDWINLNHKGFKLRDAKYPNIENDHEGIGLLDSLNTSNSPIKIDNCEWYLMDVKGGNNTTFDYIDVTKDKSGGYPTIKDNIDTKISFGDTEIKNYSFLTEGAAGSQFSCDDNTYNKYHKLLTDKVKSKLTDAVLSYKKGTII